jgi:hypothetical protein
MPYFEIYLKYLGLGIVHVAKMKCLNYRIL